MEGLKVNLEKTKLLVMGGEREEVVKVVRYPCGVIRDVLVWADVVLQLTSNALHVLGGGGEGGRCSGGWCCWSGDLVLQIG